MLITIRDDNLPRSTWPQIRNNGIIQSSLVVSDTRIKGCAHIA